MKKTNWDQNPAVYVGYLWRNLKTYYDKGLEPYGLTGAMYFYLLVIHADRECTLAKLARSLQVDKAYVTRMVTRLEGLGYVTRSRHPEDSRAFLLELTRAGEHILQVMAGLLDDWNQGLADILTKEEYREFAVLLGKIFQANHDR